MSSKWKGERGKSRIIRKLGKEGNIKRKGKDKGKRRKSNLVMYLVFKSFLILNWTSKLIMGKVIKTCKGNWGHLGAILGVTLGWWGK